MQTYKGFAFPSARALSVDTAKNEYQNWNQKKPSTNWTAHYDDQHVLPGENVDRRIIIHYTKRGQLLMVVWHSLYDLHLEWSMLWPAKHIHCWLPMSLYWPDGGAHRSCTLWTLDSQQVHGRLQYVLKNSFWVHEHIPLVRLKWYYA